MPDSAAVGNKDLIDGLYETCCKKYKVFSNYLKYKNNPKSSNANYFLVNGSFLTFTDNPSSDCENRIVIRMSLYNQLTSKQKTQVMKAALQAINRSGMSHQSKLFLYDFVAELDTGTSGIVSNLSDDTATDFAAAYNWFKPFNGVLGTFLAVIALVTAVFLVLGVLIDIMYMSLPYFRIAVDKGEDVKPALVSGEAWRAVVDGEKEGKERRSVPALYFKKRVGYILAFSISTVYLLSGQVYGIIGWLIDIFEGVFKKFG